MNQDTIFYGSAPSQPPVQNVVGSSSNSVVSNSSNYGSVNSLPQNFVVVNSAACSCTSNYGDMTCGSPDCINKFQQKASAQRRVIAQSLPLDEPGWGKLKFSRSNDMNRSYEP
ncbi:hypothetical protein DdX_03021 [Ditylenchus destructor]|uniref:Uncharacterized protein n=1 Tax=Ditylenchus destructor TaxID=166010 RepID=A0AAD4NIK9_9BILA|nr:hypothetical protein DdX_03021 [Ditylenchus destructor]